MADSSVDNGASSKPCYSASSSNHSGRELDKAVAALTGLKNPIVIAKLIRSGKIDDAFAKLRDSYPQIFQVPSHIFRSASSGVSQTR